MSLPSLPAAKDGGNCGLFCGENESHDEPIQSQHFGKDEDEDHPDEEAGLLGRTSDACVTYDADGKACSQTAQTHTQPCAQVQEAPKHTHTKEG